MTELIRNKLGKKGKIRIYGDTYIDKDDQEWHEIGSREHIVTKENSAILIGFATLFSADNHDLCKYIDVEHGIEGGQHRDRATAKKLFEERVEIYIGKTLWIE